METYEMYTNFDEYKGQLTLFSDSVNQQQPVRRCIDCAARITSILHVDEQHSTIDIHYNFERYAHGDSTPFAQPYKYEVFEKGFGVVEDVDAYFSGMMRENSTDYEFWHHKISILVPLEVQQIYNYINNKDNYSAKAYIDTDIEEYRELTIEIPYGLFVNFIDAYNHYANEFGIRRNNIHRYVAS